MWKPLWIPLFIMNFADRLNSEFNIFAKKNKLNEIKLYFKSISVRVFYRLSEIDFASEFSFVDLSPPPLVLSINYQRLLLYIQYPRHQLLGPIVYVHLLQFFLSSFFSTASILSSASLLASSMWSWVISCAVTSAYWHRSQ